METKLRGNLHSTFYRSRTLSNWSNIFLENRLYVFSTSPGKGGKEAQFWGKYKLASSSAYRIEDLSEFCDVILPFERSVCPTVQKRRRKQGREKLGNARQNKLAGNCFATNNKNSKTLYYEAEMTLMIFKYVKLSVRALS